MYSKKVIDFLSRKKIKEFDLVKINQNGLTLEGLLLPRSDSGDEDCIVIKLASGYNAGIRFDSSLEIEKTGEKKFLQPKAFKPARNKSLPKIVLIATGGTIASRVDYETGGVKALETPEELLSRFPALTECVDVVKVVSPFTVMSEDITSDEWVSLAETIEKELPHCDGVVITHGTDFLSYTATALAFLLPNLQKPVLLVGAQRSPDRASFDGALNLQCAAHFVNSGFKGVAVVMHATSNDDYCFVHKPTKVRKMHSSRRDAFRSINDSPIARVYANGKTELLQAFFEPKNFSSKKKFGKVFLLKAFPNSDPKIIDLLVENKVKGIIIEAGALGHVPTNGKLSWIPHIEKAIKSGVFVGVTSQCFYGRVSNSVYSNLRKLAKTGAVFLGDALSEAMLVKLSWALEQGINLDELMLDNLTGEFNDRLTQELFLN
ncbi:Glu-tRNA(Gln) amidotransferase subunit GatD [Candidatus Micrarchaeota archaeon]|nr:Glu-tRNA(Gln) amidotransferase subunit GatD [Candidatus Micrarchaeota archaeon]